MRRVVLAWFATVLVFGGCDGGSTDTDNAGSRDTPDSTIATDDASPEDQRFCDLARTYIEQSTGRGAPGDPRGLGESLQGSQSIISEMQEVAPAEIVRDVVTLTEVLCLVVPALEAADFDLTQVPPDALERLQDPEFEASATRVRTYTESACAPVTGAS